MKYLSEIISLLALAVSILAYRRYSKFYDLSSKQKDMEIELQRLSLNYDEETAIKNRSDSLKHHQEVYNNVYDNFCPIVEKLELAAGKAHSRIYEYLRASNVEVQNRDVCHIYLNVLEDSKRQFDYSLTKSNGTYLITQLREIRWMDDSDLVCTTNHNGSLFEKIKKLFGEHDTPYHGPYQALVRSPKFFKHWTAFTQAFPAQEADEIYRAIYPALEEYMRIHAGFYDELKALEKRLLKSLKRNRNEDFSLEGLPRFKRAFDRLLRDIDKLSALTPRPTIPIPDDTRIGNALECLIFAGCIVYFTQNTWLWGHALREWSSAERDYTV